LMHHQMSSTLFVPTIRYAWYASGYLIADSGYFSTIKDICFTLEESVCEEENCDNSFFIRYSWCRKELCFEHFFFLPIT
jgi:hypothetical protein